MAWYHVGSCDCPVGDCHCAGETSSVIVITPDSYEPPRIGRRKTCKECKSDYPVKEIYQGYCNYCWDPPVNEDYIYGNHK